MAVLGVYLAKLTIFVGCAQCVLFSDGQSAGGPDVAGGGRVGGSVGDGGGGSEEVLDDDHLHDLHTLTVSAAVKSCLAGADPFLPCINEQAMAAIEQTESRDSVLLDSGLEISRRPGTESFAAPRGVYSLGDNPYNVGAVIEAASSLLSRRTFCWDMSLLYPGLQMRIGPTYTGRGIIDFIVDPRRKFDDRSLGYGHMIFKRSLLPNVLATQISIASVIPIIFAAIYFLTKKAFILSKIALVVTSVVGYGSLFLHHSSKPFAGHSFGGHQPFDGQNLFGGSYHSPVGGHHHHQYHHPIGGHHNAFVGDIRGEKFYGNSNGFQQISSSKPSSLFRGVNYFPQDDDHITKYTESVDRNKKETQ
ncbi:uncharacterized protein LOC100575455 [Acyrthosiphon pisum]|uniref:Uncharacterized protein n=1 Tax=Acyrthosiphon pisum TaxID=7029 RepID=A0A8R1W844_ACYPI|nr:uncharacterized protein LOC100575455 [Acyrthosiphon pisum]|eukprot:XP_003244008.1 PREDICTED: uncharacterized protein LOC100575455 [Acyrthosiphon pisum]